MFIAGPDVLWELWEFIAAGLYKNGKGVIRGVFPFSALLFFAGVLFGYFVMLPYGYYFLFGYGLEQTRPDPKLEEYLSFVTTLTLALGIIFQLPLIMMVLPPVGLLDPKSYSEHRRMVLIGSPGTSALPAPPLARHARPRDKRPSTHPGRVHRCLPLELRALHAPELRLERVHRVREPAPPVAPGPRRGHQPGGPAARAQPRRG